MTPPLFRLLERKSPRNDHSEGVLFAVDVDVDVDVDVETDSKEWEIQSCLHGSSSSSRNTSTNTSTNTNNASSSVSVDLTHLRHLALSPGGLKTVALRRQAWPKLVAAHQVLYSYQHDHHPATAAAGEAATAATSAGEAATAAVESPTNDRRTRRTIQRLAARAKWSKHQITQSPKTFHELLGLVLSTEEAASIVPPFTPENAPYQGILTTPSSSSLPRHTPTTTSTTTTNRILRRVSFDVSLDDIHHAGEDKEAAAAARREQLQQLRRDERQVLCKLLEHLHRCCCCGHDHDHDQYSSYILQDGIQNRLAVLWIVLESPSVTSITSLQLVQYPWRMKRIRQELQDGCDASDDEDDDDDDDLFLQLLLVWDPTLYHHLRTLGYHATPTCIQTSWVPHWLSQDLKDLGLLLRIWDVLFAVPAPTTIMYVHDSI
jgi:hypothetical protein